MRHESFEDRKNHDVWRVEAIDFASEGECYIAIFSGPDAKGRAEEYASWKNESFKQVNGQPQRQSGERKTVDANG